jgi:hypothetical protein
VRGGWRRGGVRGGVEEGGCEGGVEEGGCEGGVEEGGVRVRGGGGGWRVRGGGGAEGLSFKISLVWSCDLSFVVILYHPDWVFSLSSKMLVS